MRILLLGDRFDEGTPWGRFAQAAIDQARSGGHEVRLLPTEGDRPEWAGDLARLATGDDEQIHDYRNRLRAALDRMVESFNPDFIHVQHLWIPAHLALETGVPYVVSTWGNELPLYRAGPRFRVYVEQAAENAGRIIAGDESTRRDLIATLGDLEGRVIVFPDATDSPLQWLWQLGRDVIAQRRGEG